MWDFNCPTALEGSNWHNLWDAHTVCPASTQSVTQRSNYHTSWDFLHCWSYIVQRATLSYYRTSGINDTTCKYIEGDSQETLCDIVLKLIYKDVCFLEVNEWPWLKSQMWLIVPCFTSVEQITAPFTHSLHSDKGLKMTLIAHKQAISRFC